VRPPSHKKSEKPKTSDSLLYPERTKEVSIAFFMAQNLSERRAIQILTKKLSYSDLLIFLIYIGTLAGLQWISGAFDSEFGGHPDEAAHYVTGLMHHDYIAGLDLTSPLRFAENYYIHYPRICIGHWPPFFYAVQSVCSPLPTRHGMDSGILRGTCCPYRNFRTRLC